MLTELPQRGLAELIPNHKLIIVASGCKLTILGVPSKTTDFLLVPNELAQILLWLSNIPVIYESISRARRKDMVIPS
jgi:hypothetical protein